MIMCGQASSFDGTLAIPGAKQGLHLPVMNAAEAAWPIAIIFRPFPSQLAVLYFALAKHYSRAELEAAPYNVLGEAHAAAS